MKTELVREAPENEESTPIHLLVTTDEYGFTQAVARLKIVPEEQKLEPLKLPYIENVSKTDHKSPFKRSPIRVEAKTTDTSLDTLSLNLDGKFSK